MTAALEGNEWSAALCPGKDPVPILQEATPYKNNKNLQLIVFRWVGWVWDWKTKCLTRHAIKKNSNLLLLKRGDSGKKKILIHTDTRNEIRSRIQLKL